MAHLEGGPMSAWTRVQAALAAVNDAGARRGWLMAMHPALADAFAHEYEQARAAYEAGAFAVAEEHIGRAHILGSHFWSTHFAAHWLMLRIGLRRHDAYEVVTQVLRVTGTFGTRLFAPFFGTTGNPGMSKYSIRDRFPVTPDLAAALGVQSFTDWRRAR
jgi:uncharacterized protein DUF3703